MFRTQLDRFQFLAQRFGRPVPPRFPGFERLRDWFVRSETTVKTYGRVAEYANPHSGTRLFLQYQARLPGLAPFKGTLIPHDQRGLSAEEIQCVVKRFKTYRFLLLEIALDFPPDSRIDLDFVREHGLFGKSHPNNSGLFAHSALYGKRKAFKLVRCYQKRELDSFRVELEVHSAWLRQYGIVTLQNVWKLPQSLFPSHVRFVNVNWIALGKHLSRRGLNSRYIIQQAKDRSDSIHAVMEFLRSSIGIHNPHRFLLTVAPSQKIFQSLRHWARTF